MSDAMPLARVLLTAVLVVGCASAGQPGAATPVGGTSAPSQTAPGGGQPTAAPGTGGVGSGILDAATNAQVHVCTLLPADLIATIVPSPPPPEEERYPPRCSVYGSQVAIGFSIDVFNPLSETPADGTEVSGFAQRAYLERLAPGNFTLWVALTPDVGSLMVEVNNQDGQDHTDEVVNLAKAILLKLGG